MATVAQFMQTSRWTLPLGATSCAILALLLLFASDVADMMGLWWNISTYQHCLFILPLVGWLLWQRRHEVAQVEPAGWLPGLALVFAAALVWLVGQAGGIALVRHIGVVLMVQASVVAILGPAVARAIAFPLFYLVFLIPFGDEFVAPMQSLTARMTMVLLALTGIPATLDGVFITTRAGWFEVAEACAGVKFLIAMIAYAALVANVCFRSWRRRAAFMAVAAVAPVLANGVRAWGTIYAAELTSVKFATGFDHIVYGWFFFAFVTIVVMAAAWRFFDRRIGDSWLQGRVFAIVRPAAPVLLLAPLTVAVAALPAIWDTIAAAQGRLALPHRVDLPVVAGWRRVGDKPAVNWMPRFDGADHRLFGRYGNAGGQRVDVGVALYGWQGRRREIVAFGQGAADPDGPWRRAAELPPIANARVERLLGPAKIEREAATFWEVGGNSTRTKAQVKLATLSARLSGSDQSAAVLIVSSEGAQADASLRAFLNDVGDPADVLKRMVTKARGGR